MPLQWEHLKTSLWKKKQIWNDKWFRPFSYLPTYLPTYHSSLPKTYLPTNQLIYLANYLILQTYLVAVVALGIGYPSIFLPDRVENHGWWGGEVGGLVGGLLLSSAAAGSKWLWLTWVLQTPICIFLSWLLCLDQPELVDLYYWYYFKITLTLKIKKILYKNILLVQKKFKILRNL